MHIPLKLVERLYRLPFAQRPVFLVQDVTERPSSRELRPGMVLVEKRDGYLKWAHFRCPRCRDPIELPLAGKERWSISIDLLSRPTFHPSVWEKTSCGAHFFIRKGRLLWC